MFCSPTLYRATETQRFAWKAEPVENGREANFVIKIIFYLCTTAIFIQEGYTDSRRSALPLLGSKAPPSSLFWFISPFFFFGQFVPIDIYFSWKALSWFHPSSTQTNKPTVAAWVGCFRSQFRLVLDGPTLTHLHKLTSPRLSTTNTDFSPLIQAPAIRGGCNCTHFPCTKTWELGEMLQLSFIFCASPFPHSSPGRCWCLLQRLSKHATKTHQLRATFFVSTEMPKSK